MTKFLFLLMLSACTTFNDQTKLKNRLNSGEADFKTLDAAYEQLPCTQYTLGGKSIILDFNSHDKIIEIKNSRSYIKKVCFSGLTTKIVATGRYVGGGQAKAFYAIPAFIGYAAKKPVQTTYSMKETKWSGNLAFTMSAPTQFDSILIFLDTIEMDQSIGGNGNTLFISPTMTMPVTYYKYPEGKVEISSN